MFCDLAVFDGHLLDTYLGIDMVADIYITEGKIVKISTSKESRSIFNVKQIIEAKNFFVAPGFIDGHCHIFPETFYGCNPDDAGINSGCTTVVDAGSSGFLTFPYFRDMHIRKAKNRVYALLMHHPTGICFKDEEWSDVNTHTEQMIQVINENRRYIVGVKDRITYEYAHHQGVAGLREIFDVCRKTGVLYGAHLGSTEGLYQNASPFDRPRAEEEMQIFIFELLNLLQKGDILYHAFTGKFARIFRADGLFDEAIRNALTRGAVLDACPGMTNYDYNVHALAKSRGFDNYIVSTDMWKKTFKMVTYNIGAVLSRYLAFGMSFSDLVSSVTWRMGKLLGLDEDMFTLREGSIADLTLFAMEKGEYIFSDHKDGNKITGDTLMAPKLCICNGAASQVIYTGMPVCV